MKYCDLHCDLLRKITSVKQWAEGLNDRKTRKKYQITPEGLIGGVFLQTFAIFAPNAEANMIYFQEKVALFQELKLFLSRYGVKSVLSVENGAVLENDVKNIQAMALADVKIFGLVWNERNCIGFPHTKNGGLTSFGESVVERLAFYNILPDVSHLSERGFYRTAEIMRSFSKPFLATHSNARALCEHTRNLSDKQIRTIAASGGIIGVNVYPPFLGVASPAKHIAYIMNTGGEDTVAIGSDFDGIDAGYYADCTQAYERLGENLKKEGLTERQIEKVLYKNVRRLL